MNKRFMLSAVGVSAAAIAGSAFSDITVEWADLYQVGSEVLSTDLGEISGTLTHIHVVMTWENTAGDSSWASDMLIGISDGMTLISAGGYNLSFGGSSWGSLAGSGGMTGTFTTDLYGSQLMAGPGNFLLSNGWTGSGGVTTSGTITFHGVDPADAKGCDGDINGDGIVNVTDLLDVIAGWGEPYNVDDLLLVIGDWGCNGG